MSGLFFPSDFFSLASNWLALIAIVAALAVIFIEWRSRRRKAARNRVAAVIEKRLPSIQQVSDIALADMEEFIDAHIGQSEELRERLTRDLQRLALLAIVDDKVIVQTVANLRAHLASRRITPDDRRRWMTFLVNWLQSKDQSDLLSASAGPDEVRQRAEYLKRKARLGTELEKAIPG